MIARVAVSTDALVDEVRHGPAAMARTQRELARLLLAHGELVHPTTRHRQVFEDFVRELLESAPDAGKYWEALLTHARWGIPEPPPPKPLEDIDAIEPLRTHWAQYIEAAFMEVERAELLGCPDNEVSWVDTQSGIEIAHCGAHWRTRTFDRLRDLDDRRVVPVGVDRDALAQERLVPLLDGARRVTVLDQWTGRHVAHHHIRDRKAHAWLASSDHELEWMLGLVDRHADNATFSVFTAYDVGPSSDNITEAQVLTAFDDLWRRTPRTGGLARLQLFLGPRRKRIAGKPKRFPHDRHVRFDAGPAFTLSTSLDCLRFQTTQQEWNLVYAWTPGDLDALRGEENGARDFTGAPRVLS